MRTMRSLMPPQAVIGLYHPGAGVVSHCRAPRDPQRGGRGVEDEREMGGCSSAARFLLVSFLYHVFEHCVMTR